MTGRRLRHRPRVEMTPAEKERLRRVYVESEATVASIARRFGIAAPTITAVAEREGWPLRKPRNWRPPA